LEAAFRDDSLTLNDIYNAFHSVTGLSYDALQRRRNAYRTEHGLRKLRGRRPQSPASARQSEEPPSEWVAIARDLSRIATALEDIVTLLSNR